MNKHHIVVSAENTPYLAWQCKLFYFSCVTRLKHQPIVIVHTTARDWHPDFYELAKAGCAVHSAPNYRTYGGGDDLPGRNHPGSLIKAAEICDGRDEFIVLCDPDMIFVRSAEFLDCLSADFSSFMDYDQDYIEEARLKFGVKRNELDAKKEKLTVAVPYVVPTALASEFGQTWLEAIDAFSSHKWEDVMYAFGLTVVKLGLEIEMTHLTDTNYWHDEPVKAPMIHYAYGDERWTKRNYFTDEEVPAVWHPEVKAGKGTILSEVLSQIRQAGDFYRDPYSPK